MKGRILANAALSRLGGATELVALNWWILSITNSPMMVGVITAARLLPLVVAGPVLTRLADRDSPIRLLAWVNCISSCCMFLVAGVAAWLPSDAAAWWVVAIVGVRSMASAPEPSFRQIALASVTPKDMLVAAMADLSTVQSLCLLAGPLLSGVALSLFGPAGTLLLIGFLVGASGLPLFSINSVSKGESSQGSRTFSLLDTFRMLFKNPKLSGQVFLAVGPMLAVFPYTSMLPVIFDDSLMGVPGRAAALGAFLAAAGAVAGTLCLKRWPPSNPGATAWAFALLCSCPLLLAAWALAGDANLKLLGLSMVLLGFAGQIYRTLNRTAVMVQSPKQYRGALLGVAATDRVIIPLGSLLCAASAQAFGVSAMLMLMSCLNLVLIAIMYSLFLRGK